MKKSELMLLDAEWWFVALVRAHEDFKAHDIDSVDEFRYMWMTDEELSSLTPVNYNSEGWFSILLWAMFESEGE